MENKKKTILVPWDFTKVAGFALEHALNVAKFVGNDITLAHIIKKGKSPDKATEKLNVTAEETFQKYKIRPNIVVREGSIFTSIGEIASEENADLVIMGTHGIRGMQKLTGSWALKVIVSSTVPFIIVQNPPTSNKFKNVVFPLDFNKGSKEKLNWVDYLAKNYSSKFHIITQNTSDLRLIRGVKSNINFAKKVLEAKKVDYEIYIAEEKSNFGKQIINFAIKINADLILIMTTRDISLADYMIGASEQYLIASSEEVPVMCVNPRPGKPGGFSVMGG